MNRSQANSADVTVNDVSMFSNGNDNNNELNHDFKGIVNLFSCDS